MQPSKMTRRDLIKWAGLSSAAIYVAGCGGAAPAPTAAPAAPAAPTTAGAAPAVAATAKPAVTPAQPKGPVELQIAFPGRVDKVDMYDALFKAFTADHPNVTFKGLHIPDQFIQKITAMMAAGNPPDVIELTTDELMLFAPQDVIYPLDEFMTRDQGKDFDINDIFPVPQKNFVFKGKTLGMLQTVLPYAIYYNAAMFKKAGIAEPDGSWDFDQFVETTKKLVVDANKDGKPEVFGYAPHITESYYCWVWNNGAEYLLEKDGKFKANFSDPKVVEVLQLLQDMKYRDHICPTTAEAQAFGLDNISEEAIFVNQKSATIDEHFIRVMNFRKNKDMFEWNPTPFPVKKGVKRQVFGTTQCRSISKASKNPDMAWEWIKFCCGEKASRLYSSVGYSIPPSKKIANSPIFLDPKLPPKNFKYFLDALEYARPRPLYGRYGELRNIYYPILQKVWDGASKASDACKEMDEKSNAKIKEWGDLIA